MALAENRQAMRRFAGLSDDTRRQIIDQARQAASQAEMRAIAGRLTSL